MSEACCRIPKLLLRIQSRFLEIPGLKLTPLQVQECFDLDEVTSRALLGMLVEAKVLSKTRDGAYVRLFPHAVVENRSDRAAGACREAAPWLRWPCRSGRLEARSSRARAPRLWESGGATDLDDASSEVDGFAPTVKEESDSCVTTN